MVSHFSRWGRRRIARRGMKEMETVKEYIIGVALTHRDEPLAYTAGVIAADVPDDKDAKLLGEALVPPVRGRTVEETLLLLITDFKNKKPI